MAILHLSLGQTPHAVGIRSTLAAVKGGLDRLNDEHKSLELMKDSQTGLFTSYAVSMLGAPDIATVQAVFDELSALLAKLNTNGSVTDVNAAILQAHRKIA